MLVGYMRVSSADARQSVDLQRDALMAAGIDERHLHIDKASGARDDRPGLTACLVDVRAGDTLVVWKLDRLGRSLPHLLSIVADLRSRGVAFRSLTEQMDTSTAHGELLFSVFGARAHPRARRGRAGLHPASGAPGRTSASHRRRAAGPDHRGPRRRSQQGVGVPHVQGGTLHSARHAPTNRVATSAHMTFLVSAPLLELLRASHADPRRLNTVVERRLARGRDARMRPGDHYPALLRRQTGVPVVGISREHRRLLLHIESRNPLWRYEERGGGACLLHVAALLPETVKLALRGRPARNLAPTADVIDELVIDRVEDDGGWSEIWLRPEWRRF